MENNYYMFGFHTQSNILLFGEIFFIIENADKAAKKFIDSKELLNYYGVKEEWLFSPVKLFNINKFTEYKVFYKNDLDNYKNLFLKDKFLTISLRYPEITQINIKNYIDNLNITELRELITDYDNEYPNKVMKK